MNEEQMELLEWAAVVAEHAALNRDVPRPPRGMSVPEAIRELYALAQQQREADVAAYVQEARHG